ncbi:MAG: hypothetical protein ACR2RV_22995 [Verrucomicrobiales bacterium]
MPTPPFQRKPEPPDDCQSAPELMTSALVGRRLIRAWWLDRGGYDVPPRSDRHPVRIVSISASGRTGRAIWANFACAASNHGWHPLARRAR